MTVGRLWKRWRGDNPGAGLASSVADQLRWARFHLGDGRAGRGARILPAQTLRQMREPTVALRGSTLGDADEYIVTAGGMKGQRGFFSRDETGKVTGADLAGRLFTRVP